MTDFAQREGVIWMNGAFVCWREAQVHILSHALHYGSAVFEGERVYQGVIFKHEAHIKRLFASARMMDMSIAFEEQELLASACEVVKRNGITAGYVRPVVWRGSEMMAISAQQTTIHVAIASWQWPSYFSDDALRTGIRLQTAAWHRPPLSCAPVQAKAAGLYMICTLSKHQAERAGFDDALMLDHRGLIAEATGANIFFVKDGELHTPIADVFLNGITRQCVIELAHKRGLKVHERHIECEELKDMEEVFLTGTAVEITPVAAIDKHQWQVGKITHALIDDFTHYVNEECR